MLKNVAFTITFDDTHRQDPLQVNFAGFARKKINPKTD